MQHRVGGLRSADGLGGKSRDQGQNKSAADSEAEAAAQAAALQQQLMAQQAVSAGPPADMTAGY